ncbi:DMT family transporter [Streptomyces specialis]|uniref:DMT family transporter n=1 Tax=Streptomyces specialis TaxID=498367 RepID=UPI000AEBFAE4|nr:DMT family transporter [Streptomyces specialis]
MTSGTDRPSPAPARTSVDRATALAVVAIVGAALIWSTSFAVTKVALDHVPPMTIGAMRFTVAALLLGVAVRCRPGWSPPPPRRRAFMGLAGLLGITAYFALENVGVELATASDASLIVASYPIITLALEFVVNRTGVSPVRLVGMLLAIVGVWLIVQQGADESGGNRLWGDVILILGGVVWAVYNLVARRDGSGCSPLVVTYYQTLAGAAGFLLLSLTEYERWETPPADDLLRVAYLAGFCSVAAFLAYNYGLRRVSSSVAVNLLNLVPVMGLISAVVLVGETVGMIQVLGGAIVIVGVLLGLHRIGDDERQERAPGTSDTGGTSKTTTGTTRWNSQE